MKKYKAFKRLAALVLVLVLAAVLPAEGGYIAEASDTPSSWAQEEVDDARAKGLILPPADLGYQNEISRMLFCMQIVNMVEVTYGAEIALTITNPFDDIDNDYVTKAYQLGIVMGISETAFAPHLPISRQEIGVMMMRCARALDQLMGKAYAEVSDTSSITFPDQDKIASWALSDVQLAYSLNVMKGVEDNKIDPLGTATIEQSILLVNRLYDGFFAASFSSAGTGAETGTETSSGPIALSVPVEFSAAEQTELIIDAGQLAYDPDGDALAVIKINGQTLPYPTTHGTASLTTDGKLSYISEDVTENLTDDFAVTVSDGTDVTDIMIRINISSGLHLKPSLNSVTVSGDPAVGNTLSVFMLGYSGVVPSGDVFFTYQWMTSTSPDGLYMYIYGANESTYVVPQGSVGQYFKVKVTASGAAGGSATSAAVGPVTYGFDRGDGSSTSPYEISTAEQLARLSYMPTDGLFFVLTDDITLPFNTYIQNTFEGKLYGYGHTVTIHITSAPDHYIGLFSQIGSDAVVTGVVVDGYINVTNNASGSIAGHNEGTIISCTSYAAVQCGSYAGGIAGENMGNVSLCVSESFVKSSCYTGGIVGYNDGNIARCQAGSSCSVTGTLYWAGGITGNNTSDGMVIYCCAHAGVFASHSVGGLVGWNGGLVSSSYSTGHVGGSDYLGGLVGYNIGAVGHSYYDQNTSGRNDTGKGIPKTTAEMMTQSTYVSWDFTSIWGYTSGQYPWLRT